MKAAIYLRVSTDEQAEKYGVDMQRRRCEAYCAMKEWEIAEVYEDLGHSGASLHRPALQRLLMDSTNGKWDVVVSYKVDRLSRSTRDLCAIWEDHLAPHDKGLASCEESFDTETPMGRFFLKLLGTFAEMERETIRLRMEGGRWEAAKQGQWNASGVPIGYCKEVIPDGRRGRKVLVVEEQEAETVRNVFRWYAEEGLGVTAITERLNALGVPTATQSRGGKRQASYWAEATVHRILRNPIYCGKAYLHRLTGPLGKQVRPQKEWIGIEVPPIISRSLFEKAEKMRSNNRRISGGQNHRHNHYLLRDVLYCSECGGHLRGMNAGGRNGTRRYYRCGKGFSRQPMEKRCNFPYIPADRLERVVWEKVREALLDPNTLVKHAKLDEQNMEALRSEIAGLDGRLAELDKQRERLRWLFARETITLDELERDLCSLDRQRRDVEDIKAKHAARLAQQENLADRVEALRRTLEKLRGRIDLLNLEERQLLLRELGVRVVAYPDRSLQIDTLITADGEDSSVDPRNVESRVLWMPV